MEQLSFSIGSKSYKLSLENELATFVKKDLKDIGIEEESILQPESFLNAYLHLAQHALEQEKEIEQILNKLKTLSS